MKKRSITPMRSMYLDIMEKTLDAYTLKQIKTRRSVDGTSRMDIHVYSRIATVLSCLLHGGRRRELLPLWEQVMTACCQEMITFRSESMADFAIKELMLSLFVMKDSGLIGESSLHQWDDLLGQLEPDVHYWAVAADETAEKNLHNINIYNMAGEFLREKWGLTDTKAYFDRHWPAQLERFDEASGMYKDPGCPILYDVTTRVHIQLLLGFGYAGAYAEKLDELLKRGSFATLYAQSAAYEHPYGGRSNQFLFNEALIAANCEYEALRYASQGDHTTAGSFKRAARLAVGSIDRWLNLTPPRHIKNKFPIESKHGAEGYGYYDKYMITLGAFIGIAYWFSRDDFTETSCPAETGGYVWQSPDCFHKIVANAAGYSIQIDTSADLHYDATGLGRLHRADFPTELALSTPFTSYEAYAIEDKFNRKCAAIGPGWRTKDGDAVFLADCTDLASTLSVSEQTAEQVRFTVTYRGLALGERMEVKEFYDLSADGLKYGFSLSDSEISELFVRVPILTSNGEQDTEIREESDVLTISLGVYQYQIKADSQAELSQEIYANRNGAYRFALFPYNGKSPLMQLRLLNMDETE